MDRNGLPLESAIVNGTVGAPAGGDMPSRKRPMITVTTRSIQERTADRPSTLLEAGREVGARHRKGRGRAPAAAANRAAAATGAAAATREAAAGVAREAPAAAAAAAAGAGTAGVPDTRLTGVHAGAVGMASKTAMSPDAEAGGGPAGGRGIFGEARALDTTVGEAILQAAATLGLPEESLAVDTLLVRRNLRSGQQLRHYGNLVVIGDVNAGAEIVATGDIIVVGALRGMAHAGAVGNEDAVVTAYYLRPTQVRIANYIGRPPDQVAQSHEGPEVARIRDGHVMIESYRVVAGRDL